jgi:hypothetical protein
MNSLISKLFILAALILTAQQDLFAQDLIGPEISKESGFYYEPFSVTLSSELDGSNIVITLDGSDPRYSENYNESASPMNLTINPDNHDLRGATPGVVLRAAIRENGNFIGEVTSRTYIFINKVREQGSLGWTWPASKVNDQEMDYAIDPTVVNDSRYKDKFEDALLDIPTISLITDPDNLFDPQKGIYVNAMNHGSDWERPASVELINPDGSPGFQIDCGVRIRGGYSRRGNFPKHAFRLFFRSDYGEAKLRFPLFDEEGADRFDKVDLRTTINYAWSVYNWNNQGSYCTMNRDVFSRDIQREMKNPYTRSRYYHLFLNGCYWGLYQTQERSEAWYAETYFGGKREDYDVIKSASEENNITEATDGNTKVWNKIWNLCENGFQNIENYYVLEGLNSDGVRDINKPILVDIDNLIDYMILIFYTANFDAPTSKFLNNKRTHNLYCIFNRKGCDGFQFFTHDNEHTLLIDPIPEWNYTGINENRVNIGSISGPFKMEVFGLFEFHPQWLHFRLSDNEEYRIRFADRVYKQLFNDGPLTQTNAQKTFMETATMIENAIIAESARWGDWDHFPARTRDDDWLPAVNRVMNEFFVKRGDIVLDQLIAEDLYSTIQPPDYTHNDIGLHQEILEVNTGYKIKIDNGNAGLEGDIFYTIDGNDPRTVGGEVYGNATDGGDEVELTIDTSITIRSRIKYEDEWSAINEICLFANTTRNLDQLKITEIQYNPLALNYEPPKDFEFIEFKNVGTRPINLENVRLIGGIEYTFPYHIILPGEFVILASDRVNFAYRYGFHAFDEFIGNLSNGGENIWLVDSNNKIFFNVDYKDSDPWPVTADGTGHSLVSKEINPTGDPNDPDYWRASYCMNGSPGADDTEVCVPVPISDRNTPVIGLDIYPNPASSEIFISFRYDYPEQVRMELSDITGRTIASYSKHAVPGEEQIKKISLEGLELSNGIYFIRVVAGKAIGVKKLVVQKQ